VIGERVPLRPSGRGRWVGHCPAHQDRVPSFTVWEDHYYCFGCQAVGDLFSWFRLDGCSFPEAVKRAAERAGVRLEPRSLRELYCAR
jgi:DNA primase